MKEVILSADDEAKIYIVPDEVADNLDKYCWDFAADWVWNGPEKNRFLVELGAGKFGVMFDDSDFIDYLNRWAFPEQHSKLLNVLGCYDYEVPETYKDYPKYNF